jgi:hypothetical protein
MNKQRIFEVVTNTVERMYPGYSIRAIGVTFHENPDPEAHVIFAVTGSDYVTDEYNYHKNSKCVSCTVESNRRLIATANARLIK